MMCSILLRRPLLSLACLLLLAPAALAERPRTEEEVKQQYQSTACASPTGWVQVRFGNALLEVRCERRARAAQPTARAITTSTPPRNGQSAEGYQRTRWGMTKDDVRRLYPNLRGRKNVLYLPGTVAGVRATTSFHFRDNALFRVMISFHPRGGERGEPECYEKVRDGLIEKYGPPLPDGDGNTWETEGTRIELVHNTAAVLNRLTATYSRKGVPADEEAEEEPSPKDDGL